MHIGVLGINHKSADLSFRETFAQACDHLFGGGHALHLFFSWVLLSTCNRTEIYFSSYDPTATHIYILNALRQQLVEEFEYRLYTYFGSDCFFHLARVTAGVDSALVGETEIQGQVKKAYEAAQNNRTLTAELHFLFQKSLKIGKNIRSNVQCAHSTLSIEEAVVHAITESCDHVNQQKILLVGLSEINNRILIRLKEEHIGLLTLCNRTYEKAQQIAERQQIQLLPWDQLHQWTQYDVIIFGTKYPHYLARISHTLSGNSHTPLFDLDSQLGEAVLIQHCPHPTVSQSQPTERRFSSIKCEKSGLVTLKEQHLLSNRKLLIDVSVPRNVDPALGHHPLITLKNLDQLLYEIDDSKKSKAQEMGRLTTQLIAQAVTQYSSLFQLKSLRRPSTPLAHAS